jgi:hypothetical protein
MFQQDSTPLERLSLQAEIQGECLPILHVFSLMQELLAYVMIYLIINIFYREFLVKNSECQDCLNVTYTFW